MNPLHGGEFTNAQNSILTDHPKRKKIHYRKGKLRLAKIGSVQKNPEEESRSINPRRFYIQNQPREIAFGDLPGWVQETFLDVALEKFNSITEITAETIKSIFEYILGCMVSVWGTRQGKSVIGFALPGEKYTSMLNLEDIQTSFA